MENKLTENWSIEKINEYISAIDPEYYALAVIGLMSKDNKVDLIEQLEYNHKSNSVMQYQFERDTYTRKPL